MCYVRVCTGVCAGVYRKVDVVEIELLAFTQERPYLACHLVVDGQGAVLLSSPRPPHLKFILTLLIVVTIIHWQVLLVQVQIQIL